MTAVVQVESIDVSNMLRLLAAALRQVGPGWESLPVYDLMVRLETMAYDQDETVLEQCARSVDVPSDTWHHVRVLMANKDGVGRQVLVTMVTAVQRMCEAGDQGCRLQSLEVHVVWRNQDGEAVRTTKSCDLPGLADFDARMVFFVLGQLLRAVHVDAADKLVKSVV